MSKRLFMIPSSKRIKGDIFSMAAGFPSPYVGTTMRVVAGELSFAGSNSDIVTLENTFLFESGTFIEWRGSQSILAGPARWMTGGTNGAGGVQSGGGAINMYDTATIGSSSFSLSSPGMSAGVTYTFRIERTGDSFELFRDDITQDVEVSVGFVLGIDTISNTHYVDGFTGIFEFLNLNGDKFNFNEIGDDVTVTSG